MLAENIMNIFQTLENQNENFLDVCTEELIVYGMNIEDKSLWYFFYICFNKKNQNFILFCLYVLYTLCIILLFIGSSLYNIAFYVNSTPFLKTLIYL